MRVEPGTVVNYLKKNCLKMINQEIVVESEIMGLNIGRN
jgi:hypothetical protein